MLQRAPRCSTTLLQRSHTTTRITLAATRAGSLHTPCITSSSNTSYLGNSSLQLRRTAKPASNRCISRSALQTKAMVNVDVSPSVILGVGLIGAGVFLWQIRQSKPWISKDYDVVISCISLLVGGILIFQGWRLDPLLLFGQLMTTGAAVSFGIEALRLRSEVYEQEEKAELKDAVRRKGPGGGLGGAALPPPMEDYNEPSTSWSARQPWVNDPQYQDPQNPNTGYYDYENEVQGVGAPSAYGAYDSSYNTPYSSGGGGGGEYNNGSYVEADYYPADGGGFVDQGGPYSNDEGFVDGLGSGIDEIAFPEYSNTGAQDAGNSQGAGGRDVEEDWD